MPKQKKENTLKEFEEAIDKEKHKQYILQLYITGATRKSSRAIENLREFCEEHLKGRYRLEVIDIYQHPELAESEQVIVAPTLIKKLPLPLRKFIGDLSETEKILKGFNIKVVEKGTDGRKSKSGTGRMARRKE
ncbi:MAG: circadian clock KaiB family protein [Alphaproteobacteria bacterium]|uniref:Circadian clock KaiB family protein n=1 Tax=Candidatus Nitrobium versatile TaxID=2884831 RepID=A0A953JAU4_9BACT|nr:circadian clock KaiB family protein [Candidatus Nitrobium versatile]